MSLEQKIMTEMKDAMKSKNDAVLRGLRAIKAEIIKAKTEPGAGGEIDEATEQKFLQKIIYYNNIYNLHIRIIIINFYHLLLNINQFTI